jgi:hemoglobin-like flavoprotein
MLPAELITRSFDLAAERAGDITPLVYGKLFARYPDMLPLFVRDTNGNVRGEMLARAIDVILDLIGDNAYGENFIRCEVVTHDGYGVPAAIFSRFFDCLADSLREILQDDWTPEMARAWSALLAQLAQLSTPAELVL